jgi:hypothetical protein
MIRGAQECGLRAGAWVATGRTADNTPDQRGEDGRSLCFDSEPLLMPLEILGFPEAVLNVASDRPQALIACRLCDVAPDGSSLLVTRALLNLTHRGGHDELAPLEPGRVYEVRVRLNAIAHHFPAGHRVRLAVSPTYFPWAWPSPDSATLTLAAAKSQLELPVRVPNPDDERLRPFEPAESPPPLPVEVLMPSPGGRRIDYDQRTGRYEVVVDLDHFGARRLPGGLLYREQGRDTFSIVENEPCSAEARSEWTIVLERGEWRVRIETSGVLSGDIERFHMTNVLDAYEGEVRIFTKTWSRDVPRDHV